MARTVPSKGRVTRPKPLQRSRSMRTNARQSVRSKKKATAKR